MNKFVCILSLFVIIFLVACADDNNENEEKAAEENTEETEKKEKEDTDGQMEVDKGLINVEVTLPATFFEGEDLDEIISDAKEEGVKEVIQNEDGSLTYKMSKATHKKMMKELTEDINESIAEMKEDDDYPSIKNITYNDSYSDFTVEVEREAFENSFEGLALLGLGLYGGYYQLFDGIDADDYKVTINVKDHETGETFDKVVFPDDLNEEE